MKAILFILSMLAINITVDSCMHSYIAKSVCIKGEHAYKHTHIKRAKTSKYFRFILDNYIFFSYSKYIYKQTEMLLLQYCA